MPELLDFPAEILHSIAKQLCRPVGIPKPRRCISDIERRGAQKGAQLVSLSRLAITCKTFRDIAQPKLFQHLSISEPFSLLHILCERPDLAASVKQLCVGLGWYISDDHCSPSEVAVYNALLATHFHVDVAKALRLSLEDSTADGHNNTEEAFAALAVAQASNIATLTIETCNWSFPMYRPESLPYLTEIDLRHGRWEGGVNIDAVQGIFAAAPSLRIFRGCTVNGVSNIVFHGNITTVELSWSVLDCQSFRAIADGFPKLEDFFYLSEGGDQEATPREISRALKKRSNTLKHLSISLEETTYVRTRRKANAIESLSDMQVLQTLELDGVSIYSPGEAEDETTDGRLLSTLLPKSICSLGISSPHENITRDLLFLAEVAWERFPCLELVRLWGLSDSMWCTLEAAFRSRSIQCRREKGFLGGNRMSWE